MSDLHQRMAADIGRNMLNKIEPMLDRDVKIALAGGLPPAEATIMMLKIAASVANAAILMALQFRKEGVDPAQLYDVTSEALFRMVPDLKEEGLAAIAAREAKASGATA